MFLYVEDGRGLNDGELVGPLDIVLEPHSNAFSVVGLLGNPSSDELTVILKTNGTDMVNGGRVWVAVHNAATKIDVGALKYTTPSVGNQTTCRADNLAVTNNAATTTTLTGCGLSLGQVYIIYVYAEDVHGRNDGFLAQLQAVVPTGLSNSFTDYPTIVSNNVTLDGFAYQFSAAAYDGRLFTKLIPSGAVPAGGYTIAQARTGISAMGGSEHFSANNTCMLLGEVPIDNSLQTVTLSGCGLEPGRLYKLIVYVTDQDGHGDGTIWVSGELEAPPSNALAASYPQFSAISPTGLTVKVRATAALGKLSMLVIPAAFDKTLITKSNIRLGTYGSGGNGCMRSLHPIDLNEVGLLRYKGRVAVRTDYY